MSTDSSGVAGRRVEAAGEGPSSPAEDGLCSLSDLAAAIERVAALIAVDAGPARDGAAALERIADIAFVLHERDIEASLCDALDAAVRDLAKADQLKQENAGAAQQALASLHGLLRRLDGAVAPAREQESKARHDINDGMADAARAGRDRGSGEDAAARGGVFSAVVQEDDAFAQSVGSLAASLHPAVEPDDAASDLPSEAAGTAASPLDLRALPDPSEDPGDLFEPLAASPAAARTEPAASLEAPTPLPPAVDDARSDDPLAPLRALSEEELIALFS